MDTKKACAIVIGSLGLGLLLTTGAEARPHFGHDDPGAQSAPAPAQETAFTTGSKHALAYSDQTPTA